MPREKWNRVEKALRKLGVPKNMIWQVERVRDYLVEMGSMGTVRLPDSTQYGQNHSDDIILLLNRLQDAFRARIGDKKVRLLGGNEAYLLATSAYLHRVGMFFSEERFRQDILPNPAQALRACPRNQCDCIENYVLKSRGIAEQIRETHNLLSAFMLKTGPGIRNLVGYDNVPYLITVCRGYRKANLREQGCTCYQNEPVEGEVIRMGLLAALLRWADAMNFCKDRAPKELFEHTALDLLRNPVALEHWLKHYFVTDSYVTIQDESENIVLICTVNFRVPTKQINGESYLDFFRPLFERHVAEVKRKELDITQYPPVFTQALHITAMTSCLAEEERDGFRDLPRDIANQIEASECKDALGFLEWLQSRMDTSEPQWRISRTPPGIPNVNPFHLGTMDRLEYFYNRHSEISDALSTVKTKGNVEVIGPRKIGKTWFLRYISDPTVLQEHGMDPQRNIFAYVDCQHRSMQQEEAQVYRKMLQCVIEAAQQTGVDLVSQPCDDYEAGMAFEQALKKLHRRGLKVILLLDEFEAMARNSNLDLGFFSHLRALATADDVNVAYVTASGIPLVDLHQERGSLLSSPFFNIFQPLRLGLFREEDSWHVVEDSLRRASTRFPRGLLEVVLEVGGGHPFLLQIAGHHAFKLTVLDGPFTGDIRKNFLESVSQEAEGHFKYYWRKLDHRERYILAALPLLWQDESYREMIEHLNRECLIAQRNGRYVYFSPLLENFVRFQQVSGLLQTGPLLIDLRRKHVLLRGKPLGLSPTNYALLTCLVQQVGQVISYEDLWQAAWSEEPHNLVEQLRSSIRSLRKALGDDADCIVNLRNVGYLFQTPPD